MAMKNATISFTGFSLEETEKFSDLVIKMSGIVQKNFTMATTHLICAHVLTTKCFAAKQLFVPLMTVNWLKSVWEDNKAMAVDCGDSRYAKYECGVFYNINMNMSPQIPSTEKNELEKIIVEAGGIVSNDFNKETCQMLILPEPSGDEYKCALACKVSCVSPNWIYESVEAGYALPPEDYYPCVSKPNSSEIVTDIDETIVVNVQEKLPRFIALSGFSLQVGEDLKKSFSNLQLEVSNVDYLDPKAEGLLALKCTRSAKMLCAVASGVPIIHPRYIEACEDQGRLLALDEFVWKESDTEVKLWQDLIRVANQWAAEIRANSEAKPFSGVSGWVSGSLPTQRILERLLEAGGGIIVTNVGQANLIIKDGETLSKVSKEHRILVTKPTYLHQVIMKEVEKPLESFKGKTRSKGRQN